MRSKIVALATCLLASLVCAAPVAATTPTPISPAAPKNEVRTVWSEPEGMAATAVATFDSAEQLVAAFGITLGSSPEVSPTALGTPSPPSATLIAGKINQITFQIVTPGWLRVTTYRRTVVHKTGDIYTSTAWSLQSDGLSNTTAGGGTCIGPHPGDCPEAPE